MKRYSEDLSVRSYDADKDGRLKPGALFNYFQEAAWRHAELLGFGYGAMRDHGLFWVISRIHLRWDHPLRWGDDVVVETWPKGISKLFALRDFVVRTADGVDAVRATSAWLTLDLESKRPRRPQEVMRQEVMLENEHAIAEMPGKLALPENLEVTDTRTARYSDLDVNRHVNNARYVDWLFDALPPADQVRMAFSELTVQFTGESRYGERLEVRTAAADREDLVYASIVSGESGGSVFDAAVGIARE